MDRRNPEWKLNVFLMYRVYLYENLLDFKREKDMKAFI